MAIEIAMPPRVSISGLERLATRASLMDSCWTASTLESSRARMASSRVNAFTTRMPCTISCMVSMMRVEPVNWLRAIPLMRRTSLRSTTMAGGTTRTLTSDIIGSFDTMTIKSAISIRRSRPKAVIRRLITYVAELAPVVRRATNSDECRSAKKPRPSFKSLSNMRRWLVAMMRAPMRDRMTAWP